MGNKMIVVLSSMLFVLGCGQLSFADCGCGCNAGKTTTQNLAQASNVQQQSVAASQAATQKAVNVGNKICPVMGGKVDPNVTYEYEGKIYNFCCTSCIEMFKKDPQQYIKKVEQELQSVTK
jgi:YHS domain-containing protein